MYCFAFSQTTYFTPFYTVKDGLTKHSFSLNLYRDNNNMSSSQPHKINTLTLDQIRKYIPPTKDKIITANTERLISLINTRYFPSLFEKYSILFYSHCIIYIPLYFFTGYGRKDGFFYDAFITFLTTKLSSAFTYSGLRFSEMCPRVSMRTSKTLYWFGWFDVVKNNLAIFILLNQPIVSDPNLKLILAYWFRSYFKQNWISPEDFSVLLPEHIETTWGNFHFVNTNLCELSNGGLSTIPFSFFHEVVFKELMDVHTYSFFLIGNMITKYCMRYSILDAYARHSLEDFESVEHLFAFYQRAGITQKTFTNIPSMPDDFFFKDIASIQTFQESQDFRLEYNIWYGPNLHHTLMEKNLLHMSPFYSWHLRKELCFGDYDVRSLQQLYTDIHNLNFMGDYYHLYYNYRRLKSQQQLLELRAPNLPVNAFISLPDYGVGSEIFTNVNAEGQSVSAFDSKERDFYAELRHYINYGVNTKKNKNKLYINELQKEHPIVWSESLDYLEFQDCFFSFYNTMDPRKEAFVEKMHKLFCAGSLALPKIFLERCKQGYYHHLPSNI